MSVNQMSVNQISVYQMSVDQMSAIKMLDDEVFVYQFPFIQMSVPVMSVFNYMPTKCPLNKIVCQADICWQNVY